MRQQTIIFRESVASDEVTSKSNLAFLLLSNRFFNAGFPPIAYIFAVFVQTPLNEIVNMPYGASILYLTFGVRLFIALVFGFQGLLWMVLGQVFIFAYYPTPNYQQHPIQSFLLTCAYSLIAYAIVEVVRKIRGLNDEFSSVRIQDILLIVSFAAFVATIFHYFVFGNNFSDPVYGMLSSFTGKFIGSMIGFYALMLLFSVLYEWKIPYRH